MGLRGKIRNYVAQKPRYRVVETSRLEEAVAKAEEEVFFTSAEAPLEEDIAKYRKILRSKFDDGSLDSLTARQLKFSPFCLWEEDVFITADPSFLTRYLHLMGKRQKISALLGLVHTYFSQFDEKSHHIEIIGKFLSQNAPSMWLKVNGTHSIFDSKVVLEKLIGDLKTGVDIGTFCGGIAINTSCFAERFYRRAINELDCDVGNPTRLSVIEAVLKLSVNQEDRLRYRALAPLLIDGLLLPYSKGNGDDGRELVQNFLLTQFGDPRLGTASNWGGVSDASYSVIKSWLAKASLDQFLSIMDSVTGRDNDATRMWKRRRRLWTSYWEAGVVDEAWVVLGKDTRAEALRVAMQEEDESWKSHGQLEGGSVQRDHAVLLLRIGDLVIADWSHNGSCRITSQFSEHSPTFYQTSYHAKELRWDKEKGSLEKRHLGHWELDVKSYIGRHTGIRI